MLRRKLKSNFLILIYRKGTDSRDLFNLADKDITKIQWLEAEIRKKKKINLEIRCNFLTVRVIKHRNSLPEEAIDSAAWSP